MDVSVICPVFNTDPALIRGAVGSVLGQTGQHNPEIILVDDGSTNPATLGGLRDAAERDDRVRVMHQARNTGPGQARAAGIAHATHDWIGFIDSDDVWVKDKLDRAQAVLRERPDTRWIGSNYATLLPNGEIRPARRLTPPHSTGQDHQAAHRFSPPELTKMLAGFQPPLGTNLLRKELIVESGGFNPRLIYGEDWLFCLRLSTLAPMDFVDIDTYILNRQGASMMHSAGRLSSELARSARLARRDPSLRPFRRQLRWYHYDAYKDAAMNNALNGRKLKGLLFAFLALSVDPLEIPDFLLFLRMMPVSGPALAEGLRRYSTWEQVILADFTTPNGPIKSDRVR